MDTRFLPPPRETYQVAYDVACRQARGLDPAQAAARAGVDFLSLPDGGTCLVPFFGRQYRVTFPSLEIVEPAAAKEPSLITKVLLLHYLATADAAPASGEWVAFRYLPDGRVYEAAFESRAPRELARVFGQDKEGFVKAAQSLGGVALRFGDASFAFRPLPRLHLACVLWLADEEMPASAQVLYDSSAGHYLPTEDLAAVGGMLGGQLLKAKNTIW